MRQYNSAGRGGTARRTGSALRPLLRWWAGWVAVDVVLWGLMALTEVVVEPVSRRSCNLAYILWVLALCLATLLVLVLLQIVLPATAAAAVPAAINRNMLPLFLAANLLTGAVNLSIDTMGVGHWEARVVVGVYTGCVCVLGWWLDGRNITLKFW